MPFPGEQTGGFGNIHLLAEHSQGGQNLPGIIFGEEQDGIFWIHGCGRFRGQAGI